MNKTDILNALKGFGMGAANVVPGVSGGTIALLTGIFKPIVDSLNALMSPSSWKLLLVGSFKERVENFWNAVGGRFLLWLFIGIVLSVFSLAKAVTWAIEVHPVQTWSFFFGLIVASAWFMIKDIKELKIKDAAAILIGLALGVGVCLLSPGSSPEGLWFVAICGAIAICSMILPGLSGSFILLILGKYDFIMEAIGDLNIPVIVVFGIGCLIGLAAFSKLLHFLMEKYEKCTFEVLTGFVIGSLVKVWPWNDMSAVQEANILTGASPSALHIPAAVIFCVVGAALVITLELLAGAKK